LCRRLPDESTGVIGRDLFVLYWVLVVVYLVDAMFRETSVHPFTNSLFFGMSGLVAALHWLIPSPSDTTSPPVTAAGDSLSWRPGGLASSVRTRAE